MRHTVTKLAEKTWCLSEFELVNAYLLEGETHAALIDTGCGIGDIRGVVLELTKKPLIILLTHGHPDHNAGIYQFPNVPVFMNENDDSLKLFGRKYGDFRKTYIQSRGPIRCPEIWEDLISLIPKPLPNDDYDYQSIKHGDVFDLGNRKIEVIHTPGHTDGSVCFFDRKTKILFSGDTLNKQMILPRQPDNQKTLIKQYHQTIEKLSNMEDKIEKIAVGHETIFLGKEIIHDYYILTNGLLNDSIVGKYEEQEFRKGDVVRFGMAELWYQCDQ